MVGRGAVLAVLVPGLLVLPVAACARPPSGGEPTDGASSNDRKPATASLPPSKGQALGDAAARVEKVGARHPDRYAGVEVVGNGLVVYRTWGGEFDGAVRTVLAGVNVSFRDAPHARKELTALAARILADGDYWTSRGVPLWTVVARHDGTGVEVGTPAGEKLLAGARERYGVVPIIVVPMAGPPVTVSR